MTFWWWPFRLCPGTGFSASISRDELYFFSISFALKRVAESAASSSAWKVLEQAAAFDSLSIGAAPSPTCSLTAPRARSGSSSSSPPTRKTTKMHRWVVDSFVTYKKGIVSGVFFDTFSARLTSTVVTHRLGRKNHSLGHHFSRFSPHWVTFLPNQFHFIMPKLKVQKVKVSIFFALDG